MRIAFDGGSFQQGILGGIHSVAVNFLNACRRQEPTFDVTLVLDPRLGPLNPAAMAQLDWTPQSVSAPVGPAYDIEDAAPMGSPDPGVKLFVDGALVPAEATHDTITYRGPRPRREFVILSRTARPQDIFPNSADGRNLGIALTGITVSEGSETRIIPFADRRLHKGFQYPETSFRWTEGCAFIPVEFFAGLGDEVSVELTFNKLPTYPLPAGRLRDSVQAFRRSIASSKRAVVTDELSARLKADGHDFYFANHFIPARMEHQKTVAWAYDLIPVLFPQFFHPDARLNFDANIDVFRVADRVYTISHNTLEDLAGTLGIDRDRLRYAGIAADVNISRRGDDQVRKALKIFGLDQGDYFVMVSTIEPRKNHMRLLQAYLQLRHRLPNCPRLVMIGQMGWDFQEVLNFRDAHGLSEQVVILSNLSVDDLSSLYTGALFSVYPSVYEGFGLPIVESMACGTPVLTSNVSSMAEIAGDAALTVDPYSVSALAEGMYRLSTDAGLRASLVAKGDRRRQDYSWDKTARTVLADLHSLAG